MRVVYGCAVTNRTVLRNVVVGATTLATLAVTAVLTSAPALATATVPPEGSKGDAGITPLETIGLFVLAPLVIFALIAAVVLAPSMGKSRHLAGTELTSPVWVGAGASGGQTMPVLGHPGTDAPRASDPLAGEHGTHGPDSDPGIQGGASGRW